jgi:hypothetical protein
MLERTPIPEAPWWIVEAVDKARARLNCIAHLLKQVPHGDVSHPQVVFADASPNHPRAPIPREMICPRDPPARTTWDWIRRRRFWATHE